MKKPGSSFDITLMTMEEILVAAEKLTISVRNTDDLKLAENQGIDQPAGYVESAFPGNQRASSGKIKNTQTRHSKMQQRLQRPFPGGHQKDQPCNY